MWILGVRCKKVYMINCLLSAPLLIWWKDESSSNSILPIQRKWTAFYWHTIQSYSWVSDTMQNGVLLQIDVHDCLDNSNFEPSQRGTTHYLPNSVSDWAAEPYVSSLLNSRPKQVLHEHPACSSPGLVSRKKFLIPFSSYFPTGTIVLDSSSSRVLQETNKQASCTDIIIFI